MLNPVPDQTVEIDRGVASASGAFIMSLQRGIQRMVSGVLVSGFVLAAVACAEARTRLYVRVGPPAPVVEVRTVAPGPRHVWVPGYYRGNGRVYVWSRGAWVVPPRPRAVWVAPRWDHARRGWLFVAGHWR
jgi:hypothetical protein